jgi:hypothetical protein
MLEKDSVSDNDVTEWCNARGGFIGVIEALFRRIDDLTETNEQQRAVYLDSERHNNRRVMKITELRARLDELREFVREIHGARGDSRTLRELLQQGPDVDDEGDWS